MHTIYSYKDLYEGMKEDKIELQSRIDKAIEYIENDLKSFLYSIEYKTLLGILKGEKNDNSSNNI